MKPPTVLAPSAIVIDAVSGQVLYERGADVRRPMASTTKIMTALIYCDRVPDSDIITATKEACAVKESSIHLKLGERISGQDLLRAILLRSANDACVAAAQHIAGTVPAFVDMMNQRAQQLGAYNTHFSNPHGLSDPRHYTTARDLAVIARAAMTSPRFREVVRIEHCSIERSIDHLDVHLRNHSHLLGHFPGADGIKTGWTVPAGHCFVGSATWSGWQLITVVMHSKDYVADTKALLKYGFYHFRPHVVRAAGELTEQCPVVGGLAPFVSIRLAAPLQAVTPGGDDPAFETRLSLNRAIAPITIGEQVGTIQALIDGRVVASTPVIAAVADLSSPSFSDRKSEEGAAVLLLVSGILLIGLVSLRYVTRHARASTFTAAAKGAGRLRRRFTARRGGSHRIR